MIKRKTILKIALCLSIIFFIHDNSFARLIKPEPKPNEFKTNTSKTKNEIKETKKKKEVKNIFEKKVTPKKIVPKEIEKTISKKTNKKQPPKINKNEIKKDREENFSVTNNPNLGYDIIIGRDLMLQLKMDISFNKKSNFFAYSTIY